MKGQMFIQFVIFDP